MKTKITSEEKEIVRKVASSYGSIGGRATLEKYGKTHYAQISQVATQARKKAAQARKKAAQAS